jgi:hypothetical protein
LLVTGRNCQPVREARSSFEERFTNTLAKNSSSRASRVTLHGSTSVRETISSSRIAGLVLELAQLGEVLRRAAQPESTFRPTYVWRSVDTVGFTFVSVAYAAISLARALL